MNDNQQSSKEHVKKWFIVLIFASISLLLAKYSDQIFHGNITVKLFSKFPQKKEVVAGTLTVYKAPADFVYGDIPIGPRIKIKINQNSHKAIISASGVSNIFTSSDNEKISKIEDKLKIEYFSTNEAGFIFIENNNDAIVNVNNNELNFINSRVANLEGNLIILTEGEVIAHLCVFFICCISIYKISIFAFKKLQELQFIKLY